MTTTAALCSASPGVREERERDPAVVDFDSAAARPIGGWRFGLFALLFFAEGVDEKVRARRAACNRSAVVLCDVTERLEQVD